MGSNQYWAGRVYVLCVYYMTGTPEGSTESGFMEKPGIEPATPGLQGIALIHYTTGGSLMKIALLKHFIWFSNNELTELQVTTNEVVKSFWVTLLTSSLLNKGSVRCPTTDKS